MLPATGENRSAACAGAATKSSSIDTRLSSVISDGMRAR